MVLSVFFKNLLKLFLIPFCVDDIYLVLNDIRQNVTDGHVINVYLVYSCRRFFLLRFIIDKSFNQRTAVMFKKI